MQNNEKTFTQLRVNDVEAVTVQTLQKSKPWALSCINRLDAGVHEFIFDVDGSPAIKLTIVGSFALEGVGVKSVLTAA